MDAFFDEGVASSASGVNRLRASGDPEETLPESARGTFSAASWPLRSARRHGIRKLTIP